MYNIGDKVKYESGYGIFEGGVIDFYDDDLLVQDGTEVFCMKPSEVIKD